MGDEREVAQRQANSKGESHVRGHSSGQGKAGDGRRTDAPDQGKGAIPIISDVPGFQAYYVVYAPDDTVTAVAIFDNYASAEESNKRALAWIETELAPLLAGPATAYA